ncbi:MAG: ABC transporter permease, partial [Planctomycetaceae bacterium]|nr:ABC transporter permease [Planctomycetaceae bacterium]
MKWTRRILSPAVMQYAGLLAVLGLLILFFSLRTESFFRVGTAILIANQIPELTLLAVAMTLVLVIGQIDLSVGSV